MSVISRISQQQANIFTELFRSNNLYELEHGQDEIAAFFEYHAIQDTVERMTEKYTPSNDNEFAEMIVELLDRLGISVVHGAFENMKSKQKNYYDVVFPYMSYNDDQEADYSILDSLGLIRRVNVGFFTVRRWPVLLSFYYLTTLGLYFAKTCKMLPEGKPP